MNLAIDIGNSQVKIGLFENDSLIECSRIKMLSLDFIENLFSKYEIQNTIVSTVSEFNESVKSFLQNHSSLLILSQDTSLPIITKYKTPETLGNDRIAAAVGAYSLHPNKNILIIDIGSCLTMDILSENSEFLGGSISPGIDLRLKALHQYTGKLPTVKKQPIDYLIGTGTNESILSGVINGIAAEINGIIKQYQTEFKDLIILTTGGDSKFFETYIKSNIFAVPNLVLIGLNKILQHNAA